MRLNQLMVLGLGIGLLLLLVGCGTETVAEPAVSPISQPATEQPTEEEPTDSPTAQPVEEEPVIEPEPAEPTVQPQPEPTAQPVEEEPAVETMVREGNFGSGESGYVGSGTAQLVPNEDGGYRVVLSDGFTISDGPDLHVVLAPADTPLRGDDLSGFVDLGLLQSTSGAQTYTVPAGVDVSQYNSIAVHCIEYNVMFSAAPLAP